MCFSKYLVVQHTRDFQKTVHQSARGSLQCWFRLEWLVQDRLRITIRRHFENFHSPLVRVCFCTLAPCYAVLCTQNFGRFWNCVHDQCWFRQFCMPAHEGLIFHPWTENWTFYPNALALAVDSLFHPIFFFCFRFWSTLTISVDNVCDASIWK